MCCCSCRLCPSCCDGCNCINLDSIGHGCSEMKMDYEIMMTQVFSRCGARYVSPRNNYALMCLLFLFEVGVFVVIAIVLHLISNRPNFQFDNSDFVNTEWSENCSLSKESLQTAYENSQLLLPLHATLLTVCTFFICFFCKPPKGPMVGCLLRYPFAVSCLVYCWLLYRTYSTIQNEHCIINNDSLSHRIDDLMDFSLLLSLYYTFLILFMFPTISSMYLFSYHVRKLCGCMFDGCIRFYLQCINCISCCESMFRLLTCCISGERQNLLRRNRYQRLQSTNWTPDQRKKLVQMKRGACPLCFSEDTELISINGCMHKCCKECFHRYLQSDLKNISAYPRRCWSTNCQTLIAYHDVEYVLTQEELTYYDQMLIKSSVQDVDHIVCPSCNRVMIKPYGQSGLILCANSNCKAHLCSSCGVLWHANQTCIEFQKQLRQRTEKADAAFQTLVKEQKWRPCPRCGLVVEWVEGCYHMTHLGCERGDSHRTDFCYFCGEELTKKDGEGWRYSKSSNEKHFPNGVYAKCVKADRLECVIEEKQSLL